jgi:alcohol dehydrogenase
MRDAPRPGRPEGYALLRLIVGGICNTDLELQRGYYGFIGTPGHEFVAEVVEADNRRLIGRRTCGEINIACEQCDWCARRMDRHCPNRTVLGIVRHPGAFEEFFTLPERNLYLLHDDVPTERAVFLEPLAAANQILDQVRMPPRTRIAVLGDGKLGLLISMLFHARDYEVHHFGRHPEKLAIAQRAGVDTRIVDGDLPRAEYQFVVDATGSAEGLRDAVAMTRPRGFICLKSTVHGSVPIDTAPIIVNELTLIGSRCGRFESVYSWLSDPAIRLEEMVTDRFPLAEAPRAFARAAAPGVLKVLIQG